MPTALSAEEFARLLVRVQEPFRTMCIVSICLGLQVGELLGLKWDAIDWKGRRIATHRSYVYRRLGDVKTAACQRWMPLDPAPAELFPLSGFRWLICSALILAISIIAETKGKSDQNGEYSNPQVLQGLGLVSIWDRCPVEISVTQQAPCLPDGAAVRQASRYPWHSIRPALL